MLALIRFNNMTRRSLQTWLLVADILAVLVISLIGFLTHYGEIRGWRWLSTFIPVLVAWFAIAPWLGVYQPSHARSWRSAWRAALAAFLSAPLAAWLRGAWLGAAVLPLFVLVLGLTNALGFLLWRLAWPFIARWIDRNG
jgi:hypothetical protein